MIIAICGPSGAGKSMLESELKRMGVKSVVNCTTREKRPGEIEGVDYYFKSVEQYKDMLENDKFCVSEKYSGDRYYGTLKEDIVNVSKSDDLYTIVVTPNGMRAIDSIVEDKSKLLKVMVMASLGVRVKRYIDRLGDINFNFDDMNEINARVNRDFGMFLNMEDYCDMVLDNSKDARYNHTGFGSITILAEQVLKEIEFRQKYKEAEMVIIPY